MTLVLSWHLKVCTLNGKDYLQILKTGEKSTEKQTKVNKPKVWRYNVSNSESWNKQKAPWHCSVNNVDRKLKHHPVQPTAIDREVPGEEEGKTFNTDCKEEEGKTSNTDCKEAPQVQKVSNTNWKMICIITVTIIKPFKKKHLSSQFLPGHNYLWKPLEPSSIIEWETYCYPIPESYKAEKRYGLYKGKDIFLLVDFGKCIHPTIHSMTLSGHSTIFLEYTEAVGQA